MAIGRKLIELKNWLREKANYIEEDRYLLTVIVFAFALTVFFYFFWADVWVLKQSGDAEMFNWLWYFSQKTRHIQGFLPASLQDFFPLWNPIVTVHFLLPFFSLFNSYRFLLLTQVTAVGLSTVTFYLLARAHISKFSSFLLTLVYATSPFTILNLFLEAFKADYIALPFIFLLFYAYKRREYKLFLLSSLFLVLSKQTLMPIVFFFGLYVAVRENSISFKNFLAKPNGKAILSKLAPAISWIKEKGFRIKFFVLAAIAVAILVIASSLLRVKLVTFLSHPTIIFILLLVSGVYVSLHLSTARFAVAPLLIGGVSFVIYLGCVLLVGGDIAQSIDINYAAGIPHLITNPRLVLTRFAANYQQLITVLGHQLFLPILSPGILAVSLPKIADALLVPGFTKFRDEVTMLLPFMFVATLFSISKLKKKVNQVCSQQVTRSLLLALLISLLAVNVVSFVYEVRPRVERNQGYPTLNCGCCQFERGSLQRRRSSLSSILAHVGEVDRVVVPKHLALFVFEDGIKKMDKFAGDFKQGDYLVVDSCLLNCSSQQPCLNYYKNDIEAETIDNKFRSVTQLGDFVLLKWVGNL